MTGVTSNKLSRLAFCTREFF